MDLIEDLLATLPASSVLTGEALADRYHHIWHMDQPLIARAVLLPHTTEQVSTIMQICHRHDQRVAVFGGLTNLVGGTEVAPDEVVISMERMNTIEEIDPASRSITVQGGVILQHMHDALADTGLLFPLTYGAKGSAQIGGMLASNAGGLRVLRYGMARALTLGVEAVLADGTVISSLKKIIKDNSGYDLKQYFIGSEGTLGIITRATLRLVEAPSSRVSAFVAFEAYDKVVGFLKYIDAGLAGTLSGYELIWGNSYQTMTEPPALSSPPLPHGYQYYVLIESLGSDQASDLVTMEDLLVHAIETDLVVDGAMAMTDTDLEWFWQIREDVHVLASQCTYDQHYDISLPISAIGATISQIKADLLSMPEVDAVYPFGHIADGNMHLIVDKRNDSAELKHRINEVVYQPLQALGGSISAEHGVGLHKKAYLHYTRSAEEIDLMRAIKTAIDPKGLLNRGRIFSV